ncbi:Carboxypeptidase regulatory-like domain-containing protein [Desulfotomaculum arcticum]|uniref:Carboxypeptidase regulatory-like domain-containing protein n=1 Tax=Desulfotruncus arcticus DSM 17038 TaxID=1121424 RepID=A0A1I2UHH6_9FIRM|nr:carboxypeptidase-like regulatory domain-containing protein [Desulfotruncus arcticus]SFG76614.1 Carboxypeptidase regulatory-like domain-containing protein [Desulfotomaculum arcticum] [Desulfotruncus arcticus DSM 17038]
MDNESVVRQVAGKDINWYGSIGLPPGAERVNVLARVENVIPLLLDNSVLRIDALVKMFAVIPEHNVATAAASINKKLVKDIETSSFIQLRNVTGFDKIVSIHHDITVDRISVRMERVSAVGTLAIKVTYLGYVMLEGMVGEFPKNEPIRGALINVKDINDNRILQTATTGSDGKYYVKDLEPGTYRVAVEAEGFEGGEKVALVMLRDQVNFVLHRL